MDKATELSLTTWYPEDHPLHKDLKHPLLGLAEETGELLGLYKKHERKPEFDWWQCKHCGKTEHGNSFEIRISVDGS